MVLSPMSQTTCKCILQWIVIGWNAIHACLKEGDYCADISSVHFWHEIIFLSVGNCMSEHSKLNDT